MAQTVLSVAQTPVGESVIRVECQMTQGLPSITIVGLPTKSIDESKERLRAAFHASGVTFPRKRITLNLAPSDVHKEGTGLDVALAAVLLIEHTQKPNNGDTLKNSAFFGEIALDGTIRPVRGLIGKLLVAKKSPEIHNVVLPAEQIAQAEVVEGLSYIPLNNLTELVHFLSSGIKPKTSPPLSFPELIATKNSAPLETRMEDISGNPLAKRAIEIAVAGGHNLLMNGPPGTGKTMLAKGAASILPSLEKEEVLELTNMYSLHGEMLDSLITSPPFRNPHHTSSTASIIGGGQKILPGEISLASYGILLLDEFPEFHRDCLEALRQPMEDGVVRISRSRQTAQFPAQFMLIATRNPCPCGNYGSTRPCSCTGYEIQRYGKKLSGPILDRIDIFVEVEEVPYKKLGKNNSDEETSEVIRKRVEEARKIQVNRNPKKVLNARLSLKSILGLKRVQEEAETFLATAAERLGLSGRSYVRTLRVAHTISDLNNSAEVTIEHIAEALQLRIRTNET